MIDNKSKFLNITDTPFSQSDPDASLGVSDDILGNDFKSTIIEFIDHSKGPFSIALQGEWGSGKTSLMNYIKSSLCEKDKSGFHSVWINTWQFSVIDSPQLAIVNILSSIINQVTNTTNSNSITFFDKVKSFLYFILKYVIMPIGFLIWIIVLFLNIIGVCKVDLTTIRKQSKDIIEDINKAYKKKDVNNSDTSISVQKLKKNIENLIEKVLRKNKEKRGFIFFIDDLDRIDPQLAVAILEILKNLFDFDKCIFVLAIDYNVVVKGLEPKLGKMNAHNKHEFLACFDKFVQLPISMPLPYYEPKLFFKKCLYDIGFFSDKDKDSELLTENLLNKFIAIAEESVGNNPRALKRLFNTVSLVNLMRCVHITKCGTEGDIYNLLSQHPSGNKKLTFILICIQIVYPSVFYFLQKYPMFTRWSAELSIRIGTPLSTDDYKIVRALKTSDALNWDYAEWEVVLFCICKNDLFLRRRFTKILALLKEIELIFDCDDNRICRELSVALPWLSVTNINSDLIDF